METLPKFGVSRADMIKRVARFKDLKGSDGGLPDSKAPRCERTLYNVIGFQPPDDENGAVISPVGDDASRMSAIPISEGFNLGYCRAKQSGGLHIRVLRKYPGLSRLLRGSTNSVMPCALTRSAARFRLST